ncbi:choice-of-anchor D domain-containing protein, partial [candidate division KSB1 bacterium]|nr:choice-of-anchor D domain-containing protein [candidate division KSB1 bacterium]
MKSRLTIFLLSVILFALGSNVFASDPPVINNLSAQQRTGTYFVDVYFDIDDDESANITILTPTITIDGTPIQVTGIDSGDVGLISKGTDKHVRWNAGIDFPDSYSDNVIITIIAADGEGKTTSGSTDPFIVDTRINKPPVDGWQTVTDSGSTYNENIVIDNNGRIWCFYLRSPGSGQPIYMKVINPDGFVYKSEQIVATASSLSANEYQSIRTALNKETGNVWMVYQSEDAGQNAGKFIIFNDTAGVEQNSTLLETPGAVHAPKLASDGTGVMWFSWHTAAFGDPPSYACFMRYNPDGTILDTDSTRFETSGSVKNTDIAIDNEGKAWLIYEKENSSALTIYSGEGSYISSYEYSIDPSPFSTRKVIYSDWENGGQWVLKKNSDPTLNQIIRFDIDGNPSIPIGEVNNCSFLLNENDRIEAVRFNSLNNRYQYSEYNPLNKSTITGWTDLFVGASYNDAVNEFIAYNSNFPTLKTYLVKTDQSVTKLKLMDVEPLTITIDLSDDEFHFGKIGIDTLKKDTLTVLNTGNATLNVSGISIDDPHFSVDQSSFSLEADQSRDVIITFEPSDTSDYEATLTITSNAFNGTQNIPLTGVGYRRTWLISLQPLTIDFGAVPLEDIVNDSFRIKNTGTEHIFVQDLQISGDAFSLSDSVDTFFLAPNDSQFIGIQFNPIAESLYTGYAYVFSNADSSSAGANLTAGQLRLSTALLDTPQVFLKGSGYVYIAPRIGVEPAEVRFDTTRIGYSKTKSFEIFNYGNDTLIVTDIYSDDDQFAIDPDSAEFTISPGDTQSVDIIFTPNTANYSRATISIESNDPANPVTTLIADGDGFTYGDPDIYVNPPQLIFNTIRIGKSQERSFYIDNRGTDNLHITSITTNSNHFKVSYDTSSYGENLVLQPGEPVIYINVTFRPLSAGNFNGQVMIHSNDPDSSQARIELIGFGRDPYLQEISVTPDSVLRFGETTIDQTKEKELIIKNDGELMLNIDSLKITNTNFVVVDTTQSFEIGESDSIELQLSFRPTAEQVYHDTLTIFNNDPDNPEVKILLTGTGVPVPPQNIVVNPTSLDFEEISKNRYLTRYIRISNSGELQLNVSGITSNMDEFSVNNEEFSLQPTEKKYVAITFNPNGNTGTFNGVISIESDDPDDSVKEISVTGTSRALNPPAISTNFDEEGIDFGKVALNSTATVYLQVFNNGEQNLVVTDISLNDPKLNIEPSSFSIYPGSYQWAKVSFTPTQVGAINKSLTIFSNASNSPEHVITVIGEGRPLYAPRLSIPTQNYSFGEIIVNEQALLNFPVTNSGEDTLNIQITSSDTSRFSINTQAFNLLAGESKNIIVLFSPDSTTSYTNRLKLITNDPQNATKYIFITGEGRDLYDPEIFVTPEDSVDFGLARTGRSTPQMVTVANRGEKELIVHSFSIDDPQFIIEPEDTSFSLKAQQEKTIRLRLKPDNTGAVSANALIKSNDPNTPEFELKLIGIGRDRAAVIALNPDTLHFNTVLIGDSLSKRLYLKNVGEKQLNVSAVARSDQNNFWVDRDNFELDSGDSGLVNVEFRPVETNQFVETLTIKSNDPFRSDAYVYLFANGRDSIPQQISVSEDIMEFGGIAVGNQLVDTLYIRNLGEKRLNITNMRLNSDAFSIKQNELSISDSGLFKLPISFLPFEIKSYEDTLVIENNDADVQIALTGSGREMTPSALTIEADTLNFGTVTIDSSVLLNFYVHNSGDQLMEILAIESGDDQFFIEADTATIGARGAKRINVLLNPSVPGQITTFLTIQTDALINGTQTVILEANILESLFSPKIAVSPAEIDFETVLKDSVYTKKIWISNIGNDTLIVSNITISDSLFSVSDSSFIVAPNNIRQLFLQLRTDVDDSTTEITGEITIYCNDILDSVVVVPLSAMIQRYLAPKIVVTPDSLDFGESILRTQKSMNLYLSNIGEVRLDIHSVTTSDSQFYVENKEIALESNMSTVLPVYFKPLKSDTIKAQLEIASNDTTIDSLIVIPLKGIGRNITPQRISLSVDNIDFGTTPMNRSKTLSFFIKNSGERSLEVSKIMITDTSFTREFKIKTNWISDNLMIVPARDSQKVDITYNPSIPDTIGIDLLIKSNDPANKTKIIGLAARSINYLGPQISFTADSLNFGELLLGGRKEIVFGIQNLSRDSTLVVSNISIADSLLSSNFKIEPANLEIAPVSSDSVLITFVPDSNRLYQTELIVQHNDAWSDSVVKITGRGVLDQQGENQLANIPGWNYDGHYPYTDALTNGPDHAWFLKDIYLNERPQSARLFVAFNDEIDIFINGSFVIHQSSDSLMKWNIDNLDISSYLKLGRNRIAAHVFNET